MLCCNHGLWNTTALQALITQGHTCPACPADNASVRNRKPHEEMVTSFLATGAYPEGTLFTRPEGKVGKKWDVYCPICNTTNKTYTGHLQKGSRSCLCGPCKQKQAYINLVKDGETDIAVKFGIAFNYKARVYTQNLKSCLSVTNMGVWEFPTVSDCRLAERACIRELCTGVLDKHTLPDGYTETTYISNIDKIIKIYEQYGGESIINISYKI